MKEILIVLTIVYFINYPFQKFINSVPENWNYKLMHDNKILISKKDSIKIFYCGYGTRGYEDTIKMSYEICIEKNDRLSNREIKKRRSLQDSILHSLKKKYKTDPDRSTASDLIYFRLNANLIDSLRIPFYSDENYSYFQRNNFPFGYCYVNDSIEKEIDDVNLRILKRK